MNSTPTDPSDRLLDSLLREQHRHAPDEALLAGIDKAIRTAPAAVTATAPPPRRRSFAVPLTAAAALALGVGTAVIWRTHPRDDLAGSPMCVADARREAPDVPGKTPLTRHAALWNDSPFTVKPPPSVPPGDPGAATLRQLPGGPPPQDSAAVAAAKVELEALEKTQGKTANPERGDFDRRIAELRTIIDEAAKTSVPPPAGFNRDQYDRTIDQPWRSPWQDARSTFSIDVDAASYTNVRNLVTSGRPVPPDAVRIEEFINYFDYRYAPPADGSAFALSGTLATCPWQPQHLLARVAIKGREIDRQARPASNLVFLIDVSGSMQDPRKLPLLKRSLRTLLEQLDERDHLAMVVYAGSEGVVLPPTTLDRDGVARAVSALDQLQAGGSTNGGAGLRLAYAMAAQNLVKGAVNRVILATDGDFNVGVTRKDDLVALVKEEAAKGIALTVLGFGTDNLNDAMMEAVSNDGNGNYYYIDQEAEAARVFQQKLTGTLVTIAKDVKIQVEFNPGKVKAYRLIGYANRILRHEDFNNDKVDAGDIGAGHTVTAFYEIVPQGVASPDTDSVDDLRYQRPANREAVTSGEWFTLKLRHKHPEGDASTLLEAVMDGTPQPWDRTDTDFRFASAVALAGMKFRRMPGTEDISWARVEELARPGLTDDPHERRAGFVAMLRQAK